MSKLILVTGGARSGKSRFACELADRSSERVTYIAAAQSLDNEMSERILLHKKNRNKNWRTIEEPKDLERIKELLAKNDEVILFECLTLLVSNMLCSGIKEKYILNKIKGFLEFFKKQNNCAVFVTNEVGCGIVPDNRIARDFRDIQGRVNQLAADLADEVYLVVAGIGVKIK